MQGTQKLNYCIEPGLPDDDESDLQNLKQIKS